MKKGFSTLLMTLLVVMALTLGACAGAEQQEGTGDGFGQPGENETAVLEPDLDATEPMDAADELPETEPVITLEPTIEPTATEAMLESTPTMTVEPAETQAAGGEVLPVTGLVVPIRLSFLDGQSIMTMEGEILGAIQDTLIDLGDQQIQYLVVEPTDVINPIEPDGWLLIPWEAVVYSADGLHMNATSTMTTTQTVTSTVPMTPATGAGATDAIGTPTVFFTLVGVDVIESAPVIFPDEIPNVTGPNWTEDWDGEFTAYWDPIVLSLRPAGEIEATETMTGTETMTDTLNMETSQALSGLITGDALLDVAVQDQNGETLGEIEEAIVDVTSGQVEYVIITAGEILGLGGKDVPVPLEALSGTSADGSFTFTAPITEETFDDLPDFELEDMTVETLNQWHQQITEFWDLHWPDQQDPSP